MAAKSASSDRHLRGTSRDYILKRLKREKLDHLVEAIEVGRISAYAVAADLGWLTRPAVLGTGSDNEAKRRAHRLAGLQAKASGGLEDLTSDQVQELWLGPSPRRGSLFRTPEELQVAWVRGREYVMATWARNGRRPAAWWLLEAPFPWPGRDRERSALYQAGILAADERAELEAAWRQAFDEAQQAEFCVCLGYVRPDDPEPTWLEGAAARRAHYGEADIPRELVRQWSAEHRRRARTIRELEMSADRSGPPVANA